MSTKINRFAAFTEAEREILRVLLQDHLNSVSELSRHAGVMSSNLRYLGRLEKLEREIMAYEIRRRQIRGGK